MREFVFRERESGGVTVGADLTKTAEATREELAGFGVPEGTMWDGALEGDTGGGDVLEVAIGSEFAVTKEMEATGEIV